MTDDYLWRTEPGEARQLVERWIYNPALRELVELDGGTWPEGTLEEVMEALVEFSAIWDKRQGRSRLIFHDDEESRTDERAQIVYSAAERLGLMNSGPPVTTEPDYLLILGGLATGVEPRVRYAAELVNESVVKPGAIVGLGSFRELHEKELAIAEAHAPNARYEIDLLAAMMGSAFDNDDWWFSRSGDPETDPARAEMTMKCDDDGSTPRLIAMASQSSEPDLRPANTADTYEQLARNERLSSNHQLLLITSTIYRPYQHLQAVRVLGSEHGATAETIGVPSRGSQGRHPPSGHLQEVRSMTLSCLGLIR